MADLPLAGRTALITGSTQGIGLEIAKSLGSAGARIALHGMASPAQIDEALSGVIDSGAASARYFPGDLSDPEAAIALVDAAQAWSPIDILVNNAGIQQVSRFEDISQQLWTKMIAINLSAPFYTMQRALPGMAERGYGRVVNIASVHGIIGSLNKAPYVSTKHGLVGLSKVAALEYAAAGSAASGGVTVNCICPGFTRTPIIAPQIIARAAELGCSEDGAIADLLREKQPSQRLSEPSEIGAMVLWLCSPIAHNLTGTAIPIDGGWTTQ